MNQNELKHFYDLITASIEGTANSEQFAELKDYLRQDPEAVKHYTDYISMYSIFRSSEVLKDIDNTSKNSMDIEFWGKLAEVEKTAPAIEITKEEPQRKLIEKVEYAKTPRKINKFSMAAAVISLAALLVMIIYVQVVPVPTSQEIATLTDAINAKWDHETASPTIGDRLRSNSAPLHLLEGFAKMTYDNGVEVIVEAPAEFELISSMELSIDYGRLFARVSEEGKGFSIVTENSRIIDLGTEFGVYADLQGGTELQVYKGQTTLIAGLEGKSKSVVDVLAGKAKKVDQFDASVKDIPLNQEVFVRAIDSSCNLVWRGQKTIDLADIVGGGNGLGTGRIGSGIRLDNGLYTPQAKSYHAHYGIQREALKELGATIRCNENVEFIKTKLNRFPRGNNHFCPVKDNPFIDGIFVPDSAKGPTQINKRGNRFQFKETEGKYWCDISSGFTNELISDDDNESTDHLLILDGKEYGTPDNPGISIHANAGITFDLHALHQVLPGQTMIFKTLLGMPDRAKHSKFNSQMDIAIILNDSCVYKKRITKKNKPLNIEVPVSKRVHYLTIAVTDGGNSATNDWLCLAEPVLVLEGE